ncbi:hypothetical protein DFR58_110132 [Anaerobacterium chartisolvens]|uniref:Uncharacterized protein n=1 Tax=Anaerobacterium chartisolvens TaxID=1297424 RepID=A0A369BAC3_9FIRM|nr:hypothetical protein [Anaerobacterium chartisolvens]RCX16634.1 hypothetical protein DFR58_110132 [Anaerobacterium chartisolvens]
MKIKRSYIIITIYVLINVLVLLFSKSITDFCISVGVTSIVLGLVIKFLLKRKLYIYPIAAGSILLLFIYFMH